MLNAVPRSALLGWRKAISHMEIINQQHFDLLPTSDAAFSISCVLSVCVYSISKRLRVRCLFLFSYRECVCLRVFVCAHVCVCV